MSMNHLLRISAGVVLVAAQVLGVSQCAACALGDCLTREACGCCASDAAAPESAACPFCKTEAVARAGDAEPRDTCPTGNTLGDPCGESGSDPCRCQLQPRSDRPLDRPHRPGGDVGVDLPAAVAVTVADIRHLEVVRWHCPDDIPQRPVRILLGVWRN
jgi:hypothetical protein